MSLADWSQAAIKAVIEAKNEKDFESSFNALFSQKATFVDNAVTKTREEFMGELITTGVQFDSQTIKFVKVIEVPSADGGLIGAFYEITGVQGSNKKTMQVIVNAKVVVEGGAKKVDFLSQVVTDY